MATNRDLLKEAIADAKAVKETAIANAKAALEEAFTPYLKEKLSAKLAEIEEAEIDEDESEVSEMMKKDGLVNKPGKEDTMEEVSLDELLAELEEEEVDEVKSGNPYDTEDAIAYGKYLDSLEEAKKEETEEMSIEDMSEDDLKKFIEDVIKDMVEAGELEAGEAEEESDETEEEETKEESEEELDEEISLEELLAELEEVKSGNPYDTEDAIAYGKYLDSLEEDEVEEASLGYTKMSGDDYRDYCKENPGDPGCMSESKKMKKELEEAYNAIETLKSELQEINLLNAKLLYTNKLFRNKSLTESQKIKVLEAFDKATSKKEAQLVYETLLENFKTNVTKSPIKESLSSASKVLGGTTSKPIIENDAFARMRELAGLKK